MASWADITSTESSYLYDPTSSNSRKINNTLGKDAFLQLMMTQLKYQDPLNPMDNKDSIAQMAQFTALEQMQNVSSSSQKQQAFSLLGKYVEGTFVDEVSGDTEFVDGLVESVSIKSGEPYVLVAGKDVALAKISGIYNTPLTVSSDTIEGINMINGNIASLQSISLIGKTIQAVKLDAEGKPVEFIEGKVDYLRTVGTQMALVVGNKEVYPESVITVSDDNLVKGKQLTIYDGDKEISGEIKGIVISDGNYYVNIDDNTAKINNLTEIIQALSYLGKELKLPEGTGKADAIVLESGMPLIKVGDSVVQLSDIIKLNS